MSHPTIPFSTWSLSTVEAPGGSIACYETPEGLYPLGEVLASRGLPGYATTLAAFEDWGRVHPLLAGAGPAPEGIAPVEWTRRLAPILYPGKVVCAGANYFDHLEEMGVTGATKENQRLFFFMKPPRNAIVGEGDTVRMPFDTEKFDWEIELAAVIGTRARAVTPEEALGHIAGFTVAMDLCARDLNQAPDTFYKLDWNAGKGQDTCCPIGPRIVPAEALGDLDDIRLRLSTNGQLRQDGNTADMVFAIAEQISILSRIMTLDPGDVILTGTPAGVGAPRGEFLSVGDEVSAEIDHIGGFAIRVQPSA